MCKGTKNIWNIQEKSPREAIFLFRGRHGVPTGRRKRLLFRGGRHSGQRDIWDIENKNTYSRVREYEFMKHLSHSMQEEREKNSNKIGPIDQLNIKITHLCIRAGEF